MGAHTCQKMSWSVLRLHAITLATLVYVTHTHSSPDLLDTGQSVEMEEHWDTGQPSDVEEQWWQQHQQRDVSHLAVAGGWLSLVRRLVSSALRPAVSHDNETLPEHVWPEFEGSQQWLHWLNDLKHPPHVRERRAVLVRCCGKKSCSGPNRPNLRRQQQLLNDRRNPTTVTGNPLATFQYKKPPRKPRFTAMATYINDGFSVTCKGCPQNWQMMLSLQPAPQGLIPVVCPNCPLDWEAMLDLTPPEEDTRTAGKRTNNGERLTDTEYIEEDVGGEGDAEVTSESNSTTTSSPEGNSTTSLNSTTPGGNTTLGNGTTTSSNSSNSSNSSSSSSSSSSSAANETAGGSSNTGTPGTSPMAASDATTTTTTVEPVTEAPAPAGGGFGGLGGLLGGGGLGALGGLLGAFGGGGPTTTTESPTPAIQGEDLGFNMN